LKTIREDGKIYSCVGDGKVPFVSAFDIGGVAFAALTQPEPPNTDYRIVGPKAMTHDEVLLVYNSFENGNRLLTDIGE